ncbi:unnamed protein product [Leptosia nina]|uniref:Uncharacterized protein n=1 Tax=Leptosia nina TaxID=320188 RepID=A0AAV1JJ36_9NEOP
METTLRENSELPRSDSTTSNQLFVADNLDLPDDTFRMNLDCLNDIGENVTIGDRDSSIETPATPISLPQNKSSITEPSISNESPIVDTPKCLEEVNRCKQINLFKQSLAGRENDGFVKPSPIAEVMSPAKMLQFEIDIRSSATPTMKRAAIDFNFFNENTFEEYFKDDNESNVKETGVVYKETPVIVKANTVRHEIGYGKFIRKVIYKY